VNSTFPELEWIFHNILEKKRETSGWFVFLEAAATMFTIRTLGYGTDNDLVDYVVGVWEPWYKENLRSRERSDDIGGIVFYNSLLDTQRFIHVIVDSDPVVVLFRNNSQSQLHVIPE